jgi:hypothetical protein
MAGQIERRTGLFDHLAQRAHVVDRDDDLDVERLAHARVDDRDGSRLAVVAAATQEAGDLVERALRRGQANALRRLIADGFEPFEREGQVRAAFRGGERVDLVDDDRVDVAQRLARLRREHEVERLGGGDQ